MLAALKVAWEYKSLIVIAALLAALGAQSYRLLSAQRERDLLQQEKTAREREDALRAQTNLKNKERTDEDYAAAKRRAAAVRVQSQPTVKRVEAGPVELAPSSDDGTDCFDRGRLVIELTGFAQRSAERLTDILAAVSVGNATRLGAIAEQGEEVSAAYRACRAYELNRVDLDPLLRDRLPGSIFSVESFARPGGSLLSER